MWTTQNYKRDMPGAAVPNAGVPSHSDQFTKNLVIVLGKNTAAPPQKGDVVGQRKILKQNFSERTGANS